MRNKNAIGASTATAWFGNPFTTFLRSWDLDPMAT